MFYFVIVMVLITACCTNNVDSYIQNNNNNNNRNNRDYHNGRPTSKVVSWIQPPPPQRSVWNGRSCCSIQQNHPIPSSSSNVWKFQFQQPYPLQSIILRSASLNHHDFKKNRIHNISPRQPHRQFLQRPHGTFRPFADTKLYLNDPNDNENDTNKNRDRYPIGAFKTSDMNHSIVGVGVAVSLLLLLGILNVLPSLPVVTATIVLFIILRTIATSLILGNAYDDDDDNEINAGVDASSEEDENDDVVVPLSWQIDGTTLIFSYFVAAILLIPSDRIDTVHDHHSLWLSSTVGPVAVAIGILVVGCGIWFQINIVRPTLDKEQELTSSLSFTELLFYQWDQKFIQYLQEQSSSNKKKPNRGK